MYSISFTKLQTINILIAVEVSSSQSKNMSFTDIIHLLLNFFRNIKLAKGDHA